MSTLVLVVCAVVTPLVFSPLAVGGSLSDIGWAAAFLANWHFALSSVQYMAHTSSSPVLHYWSLAVEEQFYVVWPLLLLLAFKAGRGGGAHSAQRWIKARRRIVLVLTLVFAGSLAASVLTTASAGPWAYFGLHTRAWELAAGGLVALLARRLTSVPGLVAGALAWAGVLGVLWSAIAFTDATPFPGEAALLPIAGACALVAFGGRPASNGWTSPARLLSSAPMRYIGRVSYSWYLWHWPCLVFAQAWLLARAGGTVARTEAGTPSLGFVPLAVIVVGSFALASATHHLVEQPARHLTWLAKRPTASLGLGVALTSLSLVVAVVVPQSGLSSSTISALTRTSSSGHHSAAAPTVAPLVPLRETPAAAKDDRPDESSLCYVGAHDSARVPPTCIFGDPAWPVHVALVGDSHAEQWFPAIKQLAAQHHWTLYYWTKALCPLEDAPIYLPEIRGPYEACKRWKDQVVKTIRAAGKFDAILIGRISTYDELLLTQDGSRATPAQVQALWAAGSRRTFSRLAPAARHLVVLRDTPLPPVLVPDCVAQHLDSYRQCDFPRAGNAQADEVLAAAERTAAKRSPVPVSFISLTAAVCPSDPCPAVDAAGNIIYRDNSHLTATYARLLAGQLDLQLRDLLPPDPPQPTVQEYSTSGRPVRP